MKIAILHYHLNRGGVTQVIASHLRALNGQVSTGSRLPVALLFGGRCEGWSNEFAGSLDRIDLSLHPVADLDYDQVRGQRSDLATQLLATLDQAGFSPSQTVVHVHNASLGKNVALPSAIEALARKGYGCLLHLHDFAEDFRPANYRRLVSVHRSGTDGALAGGPYPQARQIHYAVLNHRDHEILLAAGIDQSRLHLLPNPIVEFDSMPSREVARKRVFKRFGLSDRDRLVLYPVRGIRRKNLGEALLWSALAREATCFGLTLPPLNPVEQASYQRWKECAKENDLRWIFEMGGSDGLAFTDNLAATDLILTTSVAEGFGLVFLEAWLANCNLVGRDLPEITRDFVEAGIQFPGLHSRLWIPIDWCNEQVVRQEISDAFRKVLSEYGQPAPTPEVLDRALEKLIDHGRLDFAQFGVSSQVRIIEKVASEHESREALLSANPWIEVALALPSGDSSLVKRNAEIVRERYSLDRCGQRLLATYQMVESSDRDRNIKPLKHPDCILERFLDLSRFHPLRVES